MMSPLRWIRYRRARRNFDREFREQLRLVGGADIRELRGRAIADADRITTAAVIIATCASLTAAAILIVVIGVGLGWWG